MHRSTRILRGYCKNTDNPTKSQVGLYINWPRSIRWSQSLAITNRLRKPPAANVNVGGCWGCCRSRQARLHRTRLTPPRMAMGHGKLHIKSICELNIYSTMDKARRIGIKVESHQLRYPQGRLWPLRSHPLLVWSFYPEWADLPAQKLCQEPGTRASQNHVTRKSLGPNLLLLC